MPLTAMRRRTTPPPAPTPAEIDVPIPPSSAPAVAPTAAGATTDVILVKSGYKHVATRVREIVFVEASRNYVRLHLQNRVVLKSRVPIDHLARHLGDVRFLRIHRSRLVSVEHIQSVATLSGGRVALLMSEGSRVIVARDRRRAVLAQLGAPLPSAS